MEKEIGKITKGEFQGSVTDIVIGIKEYNGKIGVDIREFVTGERYNGPTKKGLRIPAESFSKFKEMINSISEDDLKSSEVAQEPKEKDNSELPDY
ncbi:MAG: transcriptional coactivator p15/PC4 family protein [Candidatus Pacearchaeota archaeon]|nr:transcriptional coactivator p15/PC4 family protein [Candidatus Pacearchaeota archaeon]